MRSPDGQDMWMRWDYTAVEAPNRLEYIQNISDADGNHVDPAAIGMPPDFPAMSRPLSRSRPSATRPNW